MCSKLEWELCWCRGSFALRVFVYFLKVGALGEVSREDFSRIFVSFPCQGCVSCRVVGSTPRLALR